MHYSKFLKTSLFGCGFLAFAFLNACLPASGGSTLSHGGCKNGTCSTGGPSAVPPTSPLPSVSSSLRSGSSIKNISSNLGLPALGTGSINSTIAQPIVTQPTSTPNIGVAPSSMPAVSIPSSNSSYPSSTQINGQNWVWSANDGGYIMPNSASPNYSSPSANQNYSIQSSNSSYPSSTQINGQNWVWSASDGGYIQPTNGSSTYSQPSYSQPSYSQPSYSQPSYSQPTYSQPTYSQPTNSFGTSAGGCSNGTCSTRH